MKQPSHAWNDFCNTNCRCYLQHLQTETNMTANNCNAFECNVPAKATAPWTRLWNRDREQEKDRVSKTRKRRRTGQHIIFKSPFPWVIPLKLSTGPITAWSEKRPPSLGTDGGCWVRSAVEKSVCVRNEQKGNLCDRCTLKPAMTPTDKGRMHFFVSNGH